MFGIHAILPHKFLTSQCDLSGTAGKIAAPTSIPNRSTSFGEIEEVVEVGVSLNSTMNAARKQVLYVHDDVDADSVCASVCDEGSEGESDLEEEKDDDNLVVFRIE